MGVKVGVHGKKWDGAWRGNSPAYKKGNDRIFKGSKKIKLEKKKVVNEKQEPQLIDSSKMI